nr:unnamed protein product [Spirometra erinaceieuropaei]
MFSAMLMDAYRDERPGIRITYRTDGQLLNHRRMHFQSRVSTITIHELLFANDCAVNATSKEEMRRSMDLFTAACKKFGLFDNTGKDSDHAPTATQHSPQGAVNDRELNSTASRGQLHINCGIRTAPTVVSPSTSPSPLTPSTNTDRPPEPPLPSSSFSSSSTASTSAAVAPAIPINTTNNPDTPKKHQQRHGPHQG